jgi:N-acetylglutamate synthase
MTNAMNVTGDIFAAAMAETRRELLPFLTGGRFWQKDGVFAAVSDMPVSILNAVWLGRANPSVAAVAAVLDEIAAAGLPYSFFLRPDSDDALVALATVRNMTRAEQLPLMVLEDAASVTAIESPSGFSIRRITPEEAPVHAQVASAGFGMAEDIIRYTVNPGSLGLDTVRCYLGEADGQPAATAISMTLGRFTAIANVTTLPGFRGRGFGTAITARAAADGLAAGATYCWLQASPDGYPVYRKMGFRTIETWSSWIARS